MATKLWAMEENDLATADELEVGVEEGEAAAVQNETSEGTADVAGDADNVEAGVDASAELEQVEELVAEAAEQGEGLDPVAAEAIRLAVSVIARKVGANPKSVYSLYASENFQSASSRKGNTVHALEGVQEFLKDLWKKIKAALTNMWAKVKAFWSKHISNVGRMKKALKSMKANVRSSSGKIDGKPYLDKAPGGLISAFPGKGDLTIRDVQGYLAGIQSLVKYPGLVSVAMTSNIPGTTSDFQKWVVVVNKIVTDLKANNGQGTRVIGGDTIEVTGDVDQDDGQVTLEFEREPIEDKDDERGMAIADKSSLIDIVQKAQDSLKVTLDIQKKSDKTAEATVKFLNGIETSLAKATVAPDVQKQIRNFMRVGYKLSAFDAKIASVAATENVKACKAVLSYVSTCLKEYK